MLILHSWIIIVIMQACLWSYPRTKKCLKKNLDSGHFLGLSAVYESIFTLESSYIRIGLNLEQLMTYPTSLFGKMAALMFLLAWRNRRFVREKVFRDIDNPLDYLDDEAIVLR